jgi:hypothetical protein
LAVPKSIPISADIKPKIEPNIERFHFIKISQQDYQ